MRGYWFNRGGGSNAFPDPTTEIPYGLFGGTYNHDGSMTVDSFNWNTGLIQLDITSYTNYFLLPDGTAIYGEEPNVDAYHYGVVRLWEGQKSTAEINIELDLAEAEQEEEESELFGGLATAKFNRKYIGTGSSGLNFDLDGRTQFANSGIMYQIAGFTLQTNTIPATALTSPRVSYFASYNSTAFQAGDYVTTSGFYAGTNPGGIGYNIGWAHVARCYFVPK